MKLTEEQERAIIEKVEANNFVLETLKDDLIDHLCCVVENRLNNGHDFDRALTRAIQELAPEGLHKIEEESFILLNTQKILTMKKITYLIGLLGAMAFCIGATFKILRWEGSEWLVLCGLFSFIFLFLPLFTFNHFKSSINKALSDRLRIIFGTGSGILFGVSVVFKFLHLQGADTLLLLSGVLFSFGFLPFLFFNIYKKALTKP